MALSWSMDKLGPLGRSVGDMAIVFEAILGPDGLDGSVVEQPFSIPAAVDPAGWKVGYLEGTFDQSDDPHAHVLEELRALGVELVPIELPDYPVSDMTFVLSAEAATAFDELTRDGSDEQMVRQVRRAWPNRFRASRLIPAVEYIRANRLRTLLCRDMDALMKDVVAYVHPSFEGGSLSLTNLTGHPTVVAPCGFKEDGLPFSISFTGRLYDEARLLALAAAWQRGTGYHRRHP
jgi:Asp-tRNA(Asn)/Glu-tRNA(Gln) amidotransferase A subunit family amidase